MILPKRHSVLIYWEWKHRNPMIWGLQEDIGCEDQALVNSHNEKLEKIPQLESFTHYRNLDVHISFEDIYTKKLEIIKAQAQDWKIRFISSSLFPDEKLVTYNQYIILRVMFVGLCITAAQEDHETIQSHTIQTVANISKRYKENILHQAEATQLI